jgi:hypothetical protein
MKGRKMGAIKMMIAILKAAGYEVYDVSKPVCLNRGAGFTRDEYEWHRVSEFDQADPPGIITTNRQPLKPKAPPIPPVISKPVKRGRPKKKVNAVHKSKRRSLFDLFQRLKGGQK